jgi:hypothetical protein
MSNNLPNNKTHHLKQNIYTNQSQPITNKKDSRNVRQDKDALVRVRVASEEPVMVIDTPRTLPQNTKSHRLQNHSARRKLVQVASWVDEPIREQLLTISQSEGLSMSQTIAALLREILRERFHKQQAATLPSIIEQAVAKSNRSLATRLSWLLVRIAFDTGQTRVLATNTLGMQEGMTQDSLKEILDTADRRTKANLTRKTPQLTELMEAVEKWLLEGEEEGKTN